MGQQPGHHLWEMQKNLWPHLRPGESEPSASSQNSQRIWYALIISTGLFNKVGRYLHGVRAQVMSHPWALITPTLSEWFLKFCCQNLRIWWWWWYWRWWRQLTLNIRHVPGGKQRFETHCFFSFFPTVYELHAIIFILEMKTLWLTEGWLLH